MSPARTPLTFARADACLSRPATGHSVQAVAPKRAAGPRRGIALIEALVAVLLLSMCALAYAALQLRGLSANSSAMWRSKASLLAYDMADRMRANRSAVVDGRYDSLTGAGAAPACGATTSCSPAQMAQLDFALWSATVGNQLPGGSGAVCRDATPDDGSAAAPGCDAAGSMFAVKVFWTERGQAARLSMAVRP